MNSMAVSTVSIPSPGQPRIIRLDSPLHLACLVCGQQVSPPHRRADVEMFDTYASQTPVGVKEIPGGHRVTLTRCAECLLTRERAGEIIDAHPRLRAQIGSRSVGVHRVESALSALALLGNETSVTFHQERAVRLLIGHMTVPGASSWWAKRFAPVLVAGASEHHCASSRWAHVRDEQRDAIRDGFSRMLKARVEQPDLFAPPSDTPLRGCLLCGVGAVSALPSRSEFAWTAETVMPRSVGGQHGQEALRGYTCPACSLAVAEVGSLGSTAMERALVRFLGTPRTIMSPAELVGLKAWAIVSPEQPSVSPWDHLDLSAVQPRPELGA